MNDELQWHKDHVRFHGAWGECVPAECDLLIARLAALGDPEFLQREAK